MILEFLLLAWLAWAAFNLLLVLYFPARSPIHAFSIGGRIYIPWGLNLFLTPEELDAVAEHERGHQYHRHSWKNFVLVCVFVTANERRRNMQEIEADEYARQRGHGAALASALRKLSRDPFVHTRAKFLEIET